MSRSRRFSLAAPWLMVFFLTLQIAKAQPTMELGIREHVFENGLRLLVVARPGDHRVACKIFTDFGGIVETPGDAGAAHYLEHLMFKGTHTLGTLDWDAERPIYEELLRTEADLTQALNKARNEIRERGVFHDFRHRESTPEIDALRARIFELDRQLAQYRDGGAMMRWYQAYGGTRLTASTEQEYMKFDINLPADRGDLFLRVEADRMINSVFREFDQERMILVEQRLGDLNQPATPYYEQMAAASGIAHPVFWPEGHFPNDFYQYTRAYQRHLYERYFVVNNTTLIFVGGVTLEEMIPRVERYFGSLAPADPPPRAKAVEPVPAAERRVIYRSDQLAPRVEYRHLIPAVGHPDRPHFDVMAEVAVPEIREQLQQQGISGRVDANTRVVHTTRFGVPATLNFEIVLTRTDDILAAERATLQAIRQIAGGQVADEDLALAKKRLRVAWTRIAADPDALAFEIGHFQTMDRWQTLPEYLKTREKTTVQDLARLAIRYFRNENRTVGIVRPPAGGEKREEER